MSYVPTNSNYSQNIIFPGSSSQTVSAMCAYSTMIYFVSFVSGGTNKNYFYSIDINGSYTPQILGLGSNYTAYGMGILDDGSKVCVFTSNGSDYEIFIINTVDFSIVNGPITATSSDPTQIYGLSLFTTDGVNYYYSGMGVDNSVSTSQNLIQINATTFTPTVFSNSVGVLCANYIQCSSDGKNFATRNTSNGNIYVYNTDSTTLTATTGDSAFTTADKIMLGGTTDGVNYYLYAMMFFSGDNTYRLNTFTIGGTTLASQGNFSFGTNDPNVAPSRACVAFSTSGGTGIQRYYLIFKSSSLQAINKLYATSGGSSVGGDPHVKSISGKEVVITPIDPFLYLDTRPENLKRMSSDRIYIWCDSFNVGEHPELMSEYQYRSVNNGESFLRYFYAVIGFEFIKIDMTTLEILKRKKIGGDKYCSPTIEIGDKIDCTLLDRSEFPKIKNEKYSNDLIFYRKVRINGVDGNIEFELIRTKCINYSDIYASFSESKKDLLLYSGVIIYGEVSPPILSEGMMSD